MLLEGWPEADRDLVCRGAVGTTWVEVADREGLWESVNKRNML